MKLLFVGDPHAEVHDLEDARQLAALIWGVAKQNDATVVLAGDLYHTHAIIRAEVQYFWWSFLQDIKEDNVPCIIIKGNHDAPGIVDSKATALVAHLDQCVVVAWEPYEREGVLFCPYTDGKTLVEWSNMHMSAHTLICHQTLYGARYENGFQAGDGVNPDDIAQEQIISGHIHTPQEFGKVWYPGAPRWKTLSDANTERAIWLLDFDEEGTLLKRQAFDTGTVCRKIFHFVDTPTRPCAPTPTTQHEFRIDIHGPQSWIASRKPLFEGWAKIRTFPTDAATDVVVKESEGVDVAFEKWVESFKPRHGTPKPILKQMVKERLSGF